ncbi:hypothetical protein [Thioalkalivibrio sp. ALJ8]|uniref:hypothetical protein n=1 Tax=Thioalkalivibrio sp. ALJ8 TaxID=1158757 RepID=UPI00037FDF76|nr:hypothetical protein [Thioalkalivibrio sp. ALJ8]
MKILRTLYALAAVVVLLGAFGIAALTSGCSGLQTATDAAALDRAMDRAGELVDRYAAELPDEDATEIRAAFAELEDAHAALHEPDADLAWHYDRARHAYQRLRTVAERYWDDLPAHEQRWAEDIDQRARRLDAQVGRHEHRLRDLLEGASGLARLLMYARVV